ncbi:Sel1 domain-containing protein [Aliarcobacter faecis]|uniref:tetratricopeptide repeat protein n=3 Tax=Aliarcobacter faecis TaxID=1564138 RepID=UPI00047D76F2|nr:tetratricopeptide repeat protein [Aliarcobacter faecis]QKF73947.1 Sel1 domain-containing protein [Aliarcobacter faecis]
MKNIFKLIILITITLNFAACEQEKEYANPENTRKAYLKHKEDAERDFPKHTDMEEPAERDNELRQMGINNLWYQAVQHGKPEAATQIAMAYYEKLKDYEKAIEWLEYSNSIKPTGKNSDQACTVYSAKGDFKEAIKWCKQAVDLGYEESITGLGTVYASNKDYDNALIWLIKGDELNQPKASTNLGFVYSRLGDLKKAEEYYLKAIKNYPKDIVNVSNIIHFYHKFLKDNVRASAWAIAGINNIFLANSVADLLIVDFQIPLEDIQKGHQLQLTSDEFPYNYSENNLAMIKKSGYESWLRMYKEDKQREQETIKYEEAQRKIVKEFNERVQRDIEEKEKQQK